MVWSDGGGVNCMGLTGSRVESIGRKIIGMILIVVGIVKLVSAAREVPINHVPDPLLPFLTFREMGIGAGVLELAIGVLLWIRRFASLHAKAVLWWGCVLSSYRLGLFLVGYHGACPCLGNAIDWLPGAKGWGQPVLWGIILLLLLYGGYYTWKEFQVQRDQMAETESPDMRLPQQEIDGG